MDRTAPCLFGLFSLIVVMAKTLHPKTLPLRETSWYQKTEATFSDALAAVRGKLGQFQFQRLAHRRRPGLIPRPMLKRFRSSCYST